MARRLDPEHDILRPAPSAPLVQGETLEQQFGEKEVCFRTLDLYTSAVLESTLNPVIPPKQEFRGAMDAMAKVGPSVVPRTAQGQLQRPVSPSTRCVHACCTQESKCGQDTLKTAKRVVACNIYLSPFFYIFM